MTDCAVADIAPKGYYGVAERLGIIEIATKEMQGKTKSGAPSYTREAR